MNRASKWLTKFVRHITLFILMLPNTTFAQTISIRADINDFPATYMQDESWEGMDIDIIREIFLRAKLDYRIFSMPFKRSLIQTQDRKLI